MLTTLNHAYELACRGMRLAFERSDAASRGTFDDWLSLRPESPDGVNQAIYDLLLQALDDADDEPEDDRYALSSARVMCAFAMFALCDAARGEELPGFEMLEVACAVRLRRSEVVATGKLITGAVRKAFLRSPLASTISYDEWLKQAIAGDHGAALSIHQLLESASIDDLTPTELYAHMLGRAAAEFATICILEPTFDEIIPAWDLDEHDSQVVRSQQVGEDSPA